MKNKFFLIVFTILLILHTFANARQIQLNASDISITENGNLITAKKGEAITGDESIKIIGKKFEYNKKLKILIAIDSFTVLKKKKLEIKSDKVEYDEISSILIAQGNVEIYNVGNKNLIYSDKIILNLDQNTIESDSNTIVKDKFSNTFISNKFFHNLNSNLLKIENVEFIDNEKNKFNIDLAFVNFEKNKLIGKDINIDLNNSSFNSENEPRLKGRTINLTKNNTELTNAVFTLCKKNDSCPPWQLSAKKITHDKNKKTIKYSNAWLKIYDLPLVYFPKFFHPDPTVDRQSGFLIPSFKNSPNKTSYLSSPYFLVLDENKDLTISPRFYDNDKVLLQTEYRQVNKNSSHLTDISILSEKNKNSKNHIFYNYGKNFDFQNFSENILNIKVQQTNNDTYLKSNEIRSTLINNYDVLESSINLDLYSDNLSINSNLIIYENLNEGNSDKYEYILPKVNLVKNFDTNLNGKIKLLSNSHFKTYDTNINEKININDLIFVSNPKITKNGFYNNHEFIIKNSNSDAKNSTNFKNEKNLYLSSLLQFNSSLPMIKKSEKYQKILKPKFSLKVAPDNDKNISNEENRIDSNNIFSLNRLPSNETIEGGLSLTYGNEFSISNLEKSREIFKLNVANNIRMTENDDLPKNNQLGAKTSNFFSSIFYSPNEIITTRYNLSLRNNLEDISYENFITEINLNKFTTTFDYINENNTADKNSYLLSSAKFNFNESNNLTFATRENKTTNLTEYYNLIYQYKNDCLAASVEYNKEYYSDRDIKPEESIYFKLTIIPFGETASPNLLK